MNQHDSIAITREYLFTVLERLEKDSSNPPKHLSNGGNITALVEDQIRILDIEVLAQIINCLAVLARKYKSVGDVFNLKSRHQGCHLDELGFSA